MSLTVPFSLSLSLSLPCRRCGRLAWTVNAYWNTTFVATGTKAWKPRASLIWPPSNLNPRCNSPTTTRAFSTGTVVTPCSVCISPHLTTTTTLHHSFTTLSLFLASIPLQVRGNVVPTRRLRCQHQQCGRRGGKFVRLQSKSSKSHCHVSKNGKLRWCTVFDGEIASRRHVCRSVVRSISCHRRHGSLVL